MTETFGYRPVSLPSYVAHYQDYLVGRFPNYEPTDWDNGGVTIESLWEDIRQSSDEELQALVELWRRLEVLLDAVRIRLENDARKLEACWSSPAGEEFLRRVGAALYSLDEWREVAATNKTVLDGIASEIARAQRDMRDLWVRYVDDAEEARRNRDDSGFWAPIQNWFREDDPEAVRDRYTEDAVNIMKPLADNYLESAIALDRGTHYRGPTNARTPVFDPSILGGGAPPAPGAPAAPPLPGPPPPMPTAPPTPDLPSGPQFAGVAAPPLPTAPTLPPGAPPGAAVPPGAALPPGLPVLPTPAAAPAAAPPRPGQPTPAHNLRPAGPTPPAAPAAPRPQLQGSSPRTGAPGLPGRPSLRGAVDKRGVPASPSTPGQAPPPGAGARTNPTAPSLTGRRGGAKGRTAAGPTPPPATGATGTPLAGRRASGTTAKRMPNPRGVTRALAGETPLGPLPRPARRTGRRLDGRDASPAPAEPAETPPEASPMGGRVLGRDR